MTVLDDLLAFVLVIALPVYYLWSVPSTRRAIEAGEPGRRVRDYWHTLFELWFIGLAVVGLWAHLGRKWWEIGLWWSGGWKFWLPSAILIAFIWVVVTQVRAVGDSATTRKRLRDSMRHLEFFVPRTRRELRLFGAVGVSAGICEEIAYRGFLIWYFQGFGGMPGGWLGGGFGAVALSSLAFGFAHLYLGWRDAVRSTLTGAVLALVYLFSGSLWLPMAFHALIDLNSGWLGWTAFRETESRPI